MDKLESEIQSILDNAVFDLGVRSFSINDENEEKESEYIVYSVFCEPVQYASNVPILFEQVISINYYVKKTQYKKEHIAIVKAAMQESNFILSDEYNDFVLEKALLNIKLEFKRLGA